MERLTIMDERIPGGTRRKVISVKAVKEEAMTLYWHFRGKPEGRGNRWREILKKT